MKIFFNIIVIGLICGAGFFIGRNIPLEIFFSIISMVTGAFIIGCLVLIVILFVPSDITVYIFTKGKKDGKNTNKTN